MKNKVKRVLAGILLAAVTFTSVAGGEHGNSGSEDEAVYGIIC